MEGLILSDVIDAVQGRWLGRRDPAGVVPTGVGIDTRALKPGDIFFALPGERVDGHQFIDSAFASGACAAVVGKQWVAARKSPGDVIAVNAPDLALAIWRGCIAGGSTFP